MENKNIEIPEEIEDIGLPEDSGEIIGELLKKYGLKTSQEEGIHKLVKLIELETTAGRSEIFSNLPGTKISKLVREYAENKITLEKLPNLLKESLEISGKDAQKLTNDIEDGIIKRIKMVEKENPPLAPSLQEKESKIKRKDIYHEPIE